MQTISSTSWVSSEAIHRRASLIQAKLISWLVYSENFLVDGLAPSVLTLHNPFYTFQSKRCKYDVNLQPQTNFSMLFHFPQDQVQILLTDPIQRWVLGLLAGTPAASFAIFHLDLTSFLKYLDYSVFFLIIVHAFIPHLECSSTPPSQQYVLTLRLTCTSTLQIACSTVLFPGDGVLPKSRGSAITFLPSKVPDTQQCLKHGATVKWSRGCLPRGTALHILRLKSSEC